MKDLLMAIVLLLCGAPVLGQTINTHDHARALIHIERAPRAKKYAYLKPGAPSVFYYEWVRADGTTVIKMENARMKGVQDESPLRDSHPNLAILVPIGSAVGSSAGAGFTGVYALRR